MEERIIELETRIAYQDSTIDELNEAFADQQKQLDKLEKKLEAVLKFLEDHPLQAESAPITKPPHY